MTDNRPAAAQISTSASGKGHATNSATATERRCLAGIVSGWAVILAGVWKSRQIGAMFGEPAARPRIKRCFIRLRLFASSVLPRPPEDVGGALVVHETA